MIKVSVVMPLYNAEKYVEETINSVLKQTYRNFEVVIVDDCSEDKSVSIVKRLQNEDSRIVLVSNERNRGIAYSRNKALSICQGEYVALLDDDDLMEPERLALQVKYLDENQNVGAVGGNAVWIDEHDKIVRDTINVVTDPNETEMFLLFRNIFNNSEMTFRKSVVDINRIHYEDGCYGMEDFNFWIDFSKVSRIVNVSDLVLKKRCVNSNETAKNKAQYSNERKKKYLELQKKSFEKSGYYLCTEDLEVLEKYFGEEERQIESYADLSQLALFFDHVISQTEVMGKGYVDFLVKWFEEILIYQNERMLIRKHQEKLSETLNLKKMVSELQQYVDDLITGKDWLEMHCQDMEKYIQKILAEKNELYNRVKELQR